MSNNFLKINNDFIKAPNENGVNTFKIIGTEGFTLYTYFLYQQSYNQSTNTSIRMIQAFLCRNYDKRPELTYKNKNGDPCRIGLMKDRKTILTYMEFLHNNKYIEIHNIEDLISEHGKFSSIGINDIFVISCNHIPKDKYTLIPGDIFLDCIHKIGHVGWSLLVILSNLHNDSFGNSESNGFAYPKEEYLAETINKGLTSTKQYLYLLSKKNLIKIEEQPNIEIITVKGSEITYTRNHYIVKWKLQGNKYYLPIGKDKK
jgi:hypothetical protein